LHSVVNAEVFVPVAVRGEWQKAPHSWFSCSPGGSAALKADPECCFFKRLNRYTKITNRLQKIRMKIENQKTIF
jgi:hypothetical protein